VGNAAIASANDSTNFTFIALVSLVASLVSQDSELASQRCFPQFSSIIGLGLHLHTRNSGSL